MQEKESIMVVWCELKILSLGITVQHHSASLMMPNSYPLCIRAVSPEPSLLAHTSSESRGTFRQKARSQTHLNIWACAVKICHDGMLEDINLLDGAQTVKKLNHKNSGFSKKP